MPPIPLIVNVPPLTLPAKVAVPAVLVMETAPVVVKPAMLCATIVFAMTIDELPAVKVPPLLTKSPPRVNWRFAVASVAPLLMVRGTPALKTSAEFKVILPVFSMVTPPVAVNGVRHSAPAVRAVAVL